MGKRRRHFAGILHLSVVIHVTEQALKCNSQLAYFVFSFHRFEPVAPVVSLIFVYFPARTAHTADWPCNVMGNKNTGLYDDKKGCDGPNDDIILFFQNFFLKHLFVYQKFQFPSQLVRALIR